MTSRTVYIRLSWIGKVYPFVIRDGNKGIKIFQEIAKILTKLSGNKRIYFLEDITNIFWLQNCGKSINLDTDLTLIKSDTTIHVYGRICSSDV